MSELRNVYVCTQEPYAHPSHLEELLALGLGRLREVPAMQLPSGRAVYAIERPSNTPESRELLSRILNELGWRVLPYRREEQQPRRWWALWQL